MSGMPLGIVVVDNKIRLQRCTLYRHYHAILEAHHICPESWWRAAGKPVETPLKSLCPNCHFSVHAAIDSLIKGRDVSLLPPRCVTLARLALSLAQDNGLTPTQTL